MYINKFDVQCRVRLAKPHAGHRAIFGSEEKMRNTNIAEIPEFLAISEIPAIPEFPAVPEIPGSPEIPEFPTISEIPAT